MSKEVLIPIFEKLNITEWRNAGFNGQGVRIWNCESDGGHGANTRQMILDVALVCNVISANFGFSVDSQGFTSMPTVYYDREYELKEFVEKFKPDIISVSRGGTEHEAWTSYMKDVLKDKKIPIFSSAGNENIGDGETITASFPTELVISIGALMYKNGKFVRSSYSSVGQELDFMQSVGWWSGTSAATPFMAGMVAMMMQKYGKMQSYEVYKLLKMCSRDLGDIGFDTFNGHGQPYLPTGKYITMSTNSNEYCVDGNIKTMDTKPVNLNGNVFVPIRAISESLGADVKWEPISRTVLINDIISLQIGNKEAYLGDKKVTLNYAPFIDKNNRTLVPIRFIAEALNCKVDWVQSESKVMILENSTNR